MEDLVLWPGIKPRHLHWKVWSLSHWTTREVPGGSFLKRKLTVKPFLKQASSDLHWLCCYHTRWRWTLSFLFYFIFLTWTLSLGLAEEAAFPFRCVYGVRLCPGLWAPKNLAPDLVLQFVVITFLCNHLPGPQVLLFKNWVQLQLPHRDVMRTKTDTICGVSGGGVSPSAVSDPLWHHGL